MVLLFNWVLILLLLVFFFAGIRLVRPTERGAVERLGKYKKPAKPGFNWIIPIIDRMAQVNVTEQLANVDPQILITSDGLNAKVDLQVYYQVMSDEESIKKALYNVEDFETQIIALAQTTARDIIGGMVFEEVNSKRNKLNESLRNELVKQTTAWGINVVRVELKEITPPSSVQETMNKILMANNEKVAANDLATARETEADGIKRAEIKKAEGIKQARILEAEGERQYSVLVAEGQSKAFELINKNFVGNAQILRKLEATEKSLKDNTKIVVPADSEIMNVIGDMAGVMPVVRKK